MGNNLAIINTGLDYIYLNGIPIVEMELDIADIYKKAGRISSLAVQADPYFNDKTNAQKLFSESHGEGDRITRDFIERCAWDLRKMFIPYQRLIPEGVPQTKYIDYTVTLGEDPLSWANPDSTSIFINSIELIPVTAGSEVGISTNGIFRANVDINPNDGTVIINTKTYNPITSIDLVPDTPGSGFESTVIIHAVKYDVIGWIKALVAAVDVYLPAYNDDIRISYLVKGYTWNTLNSLIKVNGATIKHRSGNAYVTVNYNGIAGVEQYIESDSFFVDYSAVTDPITDIEVVLRDPSDDFQYDLLINTELPTRIPSPRYEFDSDWNPGKIIFRYQNMDTRLSDQKFNYTYETASHIRVDQNTFDELQSSLENAFISFLLKELYVAVGYASKAQYYTNEFNKFRTNASFWLRSEKGYQTQYMYSGV